MVTSGQHFNGFIKPQGLFLIPETGIGKVLRHYTHTCLIQISVSQYQPRQIVIAS